jgi:hypothetical protein
MLLSGIRPRLITALINLVVFAQVKMTLSWTAFHELQRLCLASYNFRVGVTLGFSVSRGDLFPFCRIRPAKKIPSPSVSLFAHFPINTGIGSRSNLILTIFHCGNADQGWAPILNHGSHRRFCYFVHKLRGDTTDQWC